ncbi:conserved hypothetical protein [Ricinus communis]|uniref:B-like cyclin n=1 Tax=Ricinus communis TaxID=3988 RepID=B9SIG5_RICCO|nr:conserved hypothetical protein [Ricinus communis]|eukprot:XP_002525784.1 uncharacterized protein LOC8282928 [Ricinus communis]
MFPKKALKNKFGEALPVLQSRELVSYLNEESQSMDVDPCNNPAVRILRANVAVLIAEISNHDKLDASITYLAMNFFDRFISRHTLPKSRPNLYIKNWAIKKVMSLIHKELSERSYSVNALCFVSNFLPLVSDVDESFKANVIKLIIQSQGDINLTQFKPSVIAASAILVACSVAPQSVDKEAFTDGEIKLDRHKLTTCVQEMTDFYNKMAIQFITGGEASSSRAEAAEASTDEIEQVEEKELMDIELKWMSDEFQDLTIHPALFPPAHNVFAQKFNCFKKID